MGVRDNITLAGLKKYQSMKLIRFRKIQTVAKEMVKRLRIRTPKLQQLVKFLSGGNQQKVVLAKWLSQKLRVLILDEPTRGIDVAAKKEIYTLMEQLAEQGLAILIISSETEEVLAVSDRVLVMHDGSIAAKLDADQLTEETIMSFATGKKQ